MGFRLLVVAQIGLDLGLLALGAPEVVGEAVFPALGDGDDAVAEPVRQMSGGELGEGLAGEGHLPIPGLVRVVLPRDVEPRPDLRDGLETPPARVAAAVVVEGDRVERPVGDGGGETVEPLHRNEHPVAVRPGGEVGDAVDPEHHRDQIAVQDGEQRLL
ncbi:hypothetical protein ACWEQG_33175 [Microbispora sp. NPDC004025]